MAATNPGTTATTVGRCSAASAARPGTLDGSGLRIVVAPTDERKGHAVPEAVGEEQLRHCEEPIVGTYPQHCLAHRVCGRFGRVVPVHDALRDAGGARGVEPERGRVRGRRRYRHLRVVVEVAPVVTVDGHRRARLVGMASGGDHDVRDGVVDDRLELALGEHGRQRYRDDARPQRAQEPRQEARFVVHDEDDSLGTTHAE